MTMPLIVDIWSDVMCPWCAVGWRRFSEGVRLAGDAIEVTVRWMPFELNPQMPPEGRLQSEHLAQTYNIGEKQIAAMRSELEVAGERVDFPLTWQGGQGGGDAPPPMMWNSFDCHKLLRWTLANEGPQRQTHLKEAMFAAHFQQWLNMANSDVLVNLCEQVGLSGDAARHALEDEALALAVRADEERGVSGGISAVPTFVINHKYMLRGAQEPEDFARALLHVAEKQSTT